VSPEGGGGGGGGVAPRGSSTVDILQYHPVDPLLHRSATLRGATMSYVTEPRMESK